MLISRYKCKIPEEADVRGISDIASFLAKSKGGARCVREPVSRIITARALPHAKYAHQRMEEVEAEGGLLFLRLGAGGSEIKVRDQDDFDAAVLLALFGGVIGHARRKLTVACSGEAFCLDTAIDEEFDDR